MFEKVLVTPLFFCGISKILLRYHNIEAVAQGMFCKKDVPKTFAKFTGKHLCRSLFFDKVAGVCSVTLLKKRLRHRCFPVNL